MQRDMCGPRLRENLKPLIEQTELHFIVNKLQSKVWE